MKSKARPKLTSKAGAKVKSGIKSDIESERVLSRPVQSRKRYLISFIIGTAVFILIFLLANYIAYLEFQRVSTLQGKTAYGIFESKLDYTFFNNDICSQSSIIDISQQLGFQGAIIDDLEKKLGKHNSQVLFQKKFYTLVELEHLDFILNYNENCNFSFNTIMFFYSNEAGKSEGSEHVGRLLDSLYRKYPENVRIYSFDVNLNSDVTDKLKVKYAIDEVPTLIINQENSLFYPKNINELETYLE